MSRPTPREIDDDADDGRDIEERLRALPRPAMSAARRVNITRLLSHAEQSTSDQAGALNLPWWRWPVPLWRATAASIALAGASVAIALGIAHGNDPALQAPIVEHAVNEAAAPAAIVFIEHEWPRRDQQYVGHASLRGWRFMPVEHGEILQ